MSHKWICVILFYGWSSYVISSGLRQYLSFVPYIIEQVPKYLWRRGDSLFFSDFFCRWFDFYTNSYKSPDSLRVIHVVSDIVCSVVQSATCDGESLRIIFKLPLLEAEDSSQTTAYGSLFCCSRPKICSPSKFLYRRPSYVDYINFNWNKYIFSSTTKEHAPHHLDSESSTSPLHTSEVEPCPLLSFYCANSSCLYVLWDYQYVFDIDMCVISSFHGPLQLISNNYQK